MQTDRVGVLHVTESATGPGDERLGPELCRLVAQTSGTSVLEQYGRRVALTPGDLTLLDGARPLRCEHTDGRIVVLTFPASLAGLPRTAVARLAAVRIPGDRGTGALVSALVRRLPRHLGEYGSTSAARLGTATLDLLGAALAETAAVPPEQHREALVERIHAYIEAHLDDPDLGPPSIAAAHHISIRYLHKLFESEGTTVTYLIRKRRLQRCSADLLDPALANRPVSATAARWGFTSAAHFSRAFRQAFGVPPSEYRTQNAAAA
jgi:AraC-like DNA-binding protein